jgi:hypothetical protein
MRAARRTLAEVDMGKTSGSARRSADDFSIKLGDALAPVPRWPCASRRAAGALARSGALEGVRRTGEGRGALYVVRRSVLDAWVEAHPIDAVREPGVDDYEQEMTKRNLRPGLAPAKPAARSRDDDEGDR